MTEESRYWNGLITGDATLAPYTAAVYQSVWDKLFASANNQGYLEAFLDELVVSGISGGVQVATGAALVEGTFYETDAVENIAVPTPSANPRIDRIVVRKNSTAQETRLFRIIGTEAASPTAPALIQAAGSVWDVPLAQVLITTAGEITLTNERVKARSPLGGLGNIILIERIVADGIITEFDFQDVPQDFKHLLLIGLGKHTDPGPDDHIELYAQFNGDTVSANYRVQFLSGADGAAIAAVQNPTTFNGAFIGAFLSEGQTPGVAGQISTKIMNYSLATLYKEIITKNVDMPFIGVPNSTRFFADIDVAIWEDTSAISRINIVADPSFFGGANAIPFTEGSEIALYGLD